MFVTVVVTVKGGGISLNIEGVGMRVVTVLMMDVCTESDDVCTGDTNNCVVVEGILNGVLDVFAALITFTVVVAV